MESIDEVDPGMQEESPTVALFGDLLTHLTLARDELTVAPYNTPPEKLEKAYAACTEDRVAPTHTRETYAVTSPQALGGAYQATTHGTCTCRYAETHPGERFGCYHPVAAKLYQRWQQRLRPPVSPAAAAPLLAPPVAAPLPLSASKGTPMLEQSPSIAHLMTAFAQAQMQMTNPSFDALNPQFGSKYSSLAAIRNTIIPALSANGIALLQTITTEPDALVCVTLLAHASGEFLRTELRLPVHARPRRRGGPDAPVAAVGGAPAVLSMQDFAGTATYAKRMALTALCCVVGEDDDDGEAALGRGKGPEEERRREGAPVNRQTGEIFDTNHPLVARINALLQGASPEVRRQYWATHDAKYAGRSEATLTLMFEELQAVRARKRTPAVVSVAPAVEDTGTGEHPPLASEPSPEESDADIPF